MRFCGNGGWGNGSWIIIIIIIILLFWTVGDNGIN
ncbi:hypothetical protein SAMN04490178_105202 [Propionispora vibrioides]|uniref:Uncharacterized protein n=1 Tax=Propionispora vibrioides TaxID=112903 RepID=A0A1H8SVW7_9FIRM|nr:hypothetical protein SAMN04490178_105202 [Propionispora vibrioides]